MPADAWLVRAVGMYPGRTALETPSARLTYAELHDRARSAAGALGACGAVPGARVALALPAREEFVVALHACLLAGVAVVPIDQRLAPTEREARIARAEVLLDGARAEVLLDGARAEVLLDGARAPGTLGETSLHRVAALHEDRVATVMHTSGTTAAPKPVSLTLGNWLWNALGSALALGLDPQERWLCPLPLAHVGGVSILIRSVIYGTTAVLHPQFDADAVNRALADPQERITLVSLVPTMLARLLDAGLRRPPTLRWALLGGGPIAPDLLRRASAAGVPVAPSYGMTEACSQIATHGWPLTGVEVRMADDGEILVRGPIVAADALAPDGWLHTGDLGIVDERGRLAITGRKADTIVTGGENVAPAEVEAALLEHPAVADAAVHARADPRWGEAVVASVVLNPGAVLDADQLRAHCARRLAAFKVPKAVEAVPELPRTPTGKLLRRQLR